MVEFALVLPIFLLILMGCYDIGRLIFTKHVLDNAVREGARSGVIEINPAAGIQSAESLCQVVLTQNRIADACAANLILVNNIEAIQVTIAHNFRPFFNVLPGIELNAVCVMRKEG